MKTVVLVDDEKRMLDLIELYLSPHGYTCMKKNSGHEALLFLRENQADLVILDVMMPEMDGWETCEKIRAFSDVPIIMLTARDAAEEMVKGLKKGADDYVTKPFNEEVLLARIEAVTRRVRNHPAGYVKFNGITLNESAYEAHYQFKAIPLTPKEFSMLGLLLKYPNKVYSRDHLLSTIWGFKTDTEDRTIDSHIRNIREKLRHVDFPVDQHLKTVWGIGYKWSSV
ncbi:MULTISPECIES: response regulator transcription factor [Peribacillus]|jgi:DNA-binding response OmpR family regulator|uniref:DNA-binding response regulator n=1 Tax=Peribacillus butanolivorans TaxID=421767 RepID=A0AAX0RZD4_9BACI|nr:MULTISPECIES: response regulator transcription factor [Peribacillus]AXN39949.1 DNA-binding response regulator [Peribacillus butanolivorans]MBK5445244.1 response regulator transcription factor [Peribacillus sp. TH24]MBK5460031.1 response regulator transcription factor [Peribacillus sp. TH27]MBK5498223.1 response regulator transcription factor [Peribacillus sp. TH14]PEJ31621.1 DNA-binding response regulator [Peribacillus butanolivorans]